MKMRSTLVLLSALAGSAIFGAEGETAAPHQAARPTSFGAATAFREYDKASQAADDAWKQATTVAERKLIEKLKPALAVATKAGNLEEANAISSHIKLAMERIEAATAPTLAVGGILRRAMYGARDDNGKAKDVTETLRACVNGGTMKLQGLSLGDPAPGVPKVLVIDGVFGGAPYTLRLPNNSIDGVSFGPYEAKRK